MVCISLMIISLRAPAQVDKSAMRIGDVSSRVEKTARQVILEWDSKSHDYLIARNHYTLVKQRIDFSIEYFEGLIDNKIRLKDRHYNEQANNIYLEASTFFDFYKQKAEHDSTAFAFFNFFKDLEKPVTWVFDMIERVNDYGLRRREKRKEAMHQLMDPSILPEWDVLEAKVLN